jgi:hypothetical protein
MDAVAFTVRETAKGYLAVAEGGSIVTTATDFESLKEMVRDAVACHYDEENRPKAVRIVLDLDPVTVA